MYGMEYVWILQDQEYIWNNKYCSSFSLKESIEGLILVSSYDRVFANDLTISGMVQVLFLLLINCMAINFRILKNSKTY